MFSVVIPLTAAKQQMLFSSPHPELRLSPDIPSTPDPILSPGFTPTPAADVEQKSRGTMIEVVMTAFVDVQHVGVFVPSAGPLLHT